MRCVMIRSIVMCLIASCSSHSSSESDASSHDAIPTPDAMMCHYPGWVPTCVEMGCDGTQSVPLYCPGDEEICFCVTDNPDGWCER